MPHIFQALPLEVPIYRQSRPQETWFYAPGYLVVVKKCIAGSFYQALLDGDSSQWPEVHTIRACATTAQEIWRKLHTNPYHPECLTLYLHNACNLECTYCYSRSESKAGTSQHLDLDTICAAARLVAQNCRALGLPFTAVFHGGGEPTLIQNLVDNALDVLEGIAAEYGLNIFRYIATNGVMDKERVHWLAERFDLVGISCDGPPGIQDVQRPHGRGLNSSQFVEGTAKILREAGRPFNVRATITRETMSRQAEIAEYICSIIQPDQIYVEPVYRSGYTNGSFSLLEEHVDEFFVNYIKAWKVAQNYSVSWQTSGSRPGVVHGPYCQVLRNVLHLLPGSGATACFRTIDTDEARRDGLWVGEMSTASSQFNIDQVRVQQLRQALQQDAKECTICFNRYHCVRACPDQCELKGVSPFPSFRCKFQKRLTLFMLEEASRDLQMDDCYGVAGKSIAL
jgi:sulfatase maturation enzyme AslB (radical SAM superfamily)